MDFGIMARICYFVGASILILGTCVAVGDVILILVK